MKGTRHPQAAIFSFDIVMASASPMAAARMVTKPCEACCNEVLEPATAGRSNFAEINIDAAAFHAEGKSLDQPRADDEQGSEQPDGCIQVGVIAKPSEPTDINASVSKSPALRPLRSCKTLG